jgi:hypothetical protein
MFSSSEVVSLKVFIIVCCNAEIVECLLYRQCRLQAITEVEVKKLLFVWLEFASEEPLFISKR